MAKDVFKTPIDIDCNGIGRIYNRDAMNIFLKSFPNQRLWVRIFKERSPKANKYFWTCCTIIGDELGYTKEEVCETMLTHFFTEEFVNEKTGTIFKKHPRLSELSQAEQADLTNKMKILAATEFNIILPEPNTQIQANF